MDLTRIILWGGDKRLDSPIWKVELIRTYLVDQMKVVKE